MEDKSVDVDSDWQSITAHIITVSAAVVLPFVLFTYGLNWFVLVIAGYYLGLQICDADVSKLIDTICQLWYTKKSHLEYSEAKTEIELVKSQITANYINSWMSGFELPSMYEHVVLDNTNAAIDHLISCLVSEDVIPAAVLTDIIQGAHLHLNRYKHVRDSVGDVEPKAFKSQLIKKFLDISSRDWKSSHQASQEGYLKILTTKLFRHLLPDESTNVLIEIISSIISENVLGELIAYLSQQENLLKIVINIFAEDGEALIDSAKIPSVNDGVEASAGATPFAEFYLEPENDCIGDSAHDYSVSQTSVTKDGDDEVTLNGGVTDETEETDTTIVMNVKESLNETRVKSLEDSFEHIESREFVSDDLSKFLKIAPPTPPAKTSASDAKDDDVVPDVVNGNDDDLSRIPMSCLMPAVAAASLNGHDLISSNCDIDNSDQSSCSGLSDNGKVVETQPEFINSSCLSSDKKFLSVSINGVETHEERSSKRSKYTLYVIEYKAVYRDPELPTPVVKDSLVYRRYREFISLINRLEKSSEYRKALKPIKTPGLWTQLSIRSLKPDEIESRKKQLDKFLRQLIDVPVLNNCKDLEEFLAYNGGGEIEFVQEKQEIIPSSVRIDKKLFKTVSGVVDKMAQNLSSSPERPKSSSNQKKKFPIDNEVVYHHEILFDVDVAGEELLHLADLSIDFALNDSKRNPTPYTWNGKASLDDKRHLNVLAESIFQLLLTLLHFKRTAIPNSQLTTKVHSVVIPIITVWLERKIHIYTSPDQTARFIQLFRETVWPAQPPAEQHYDIKLLRELAVKAVLDDLPATVVTLFGCQIERILQDVITVTEVSSINRELGFCVLEQLSTYSLKTLLS